MDGPKVDTTDMTICDEDDILPEENIGENEDILCSVLAQQDKVRTKEETQALLQGEALFKTRNCKVSALVCPNEVWKEITAVPDTGHAQIW